MRKQKTYFFTGIDGPTGHVFNTGNKPKKSDYQNLFDSVPFILDVADTAKENESGHIKIETDLRASNRSLPGTDGFSRAVMAHQLPVIKNTNSVGDVVVSTTTMNGITIDEVTRTDGTKTRRDYVIRSGLSFSSPLGSLIITPILNGYTLEVNPAISDTYKVMSDAGDPTPDYLDAKLGNGLTVDGTHRIVPLFDATPSWITLTTNPVGIYAQINSLSSNTVQIFNGAGTTLSARVLYNGTWFTEDVTGLRIIPHSITGNEITLGTITNDLFNAGAFGDGVKKGASYVYANVGDSIALLGASPNKYIGFVNDLAAPGNNYYYGTNAAGVKGWYSLSTPLTIPWENDYDNTAVKVKNTNATAHAPRSVALGQWGHTYTVDTLSLSSHFNSQDYKIHLYGFTGINSGKLLMGDGSEFYLPDDCTALITGTIVVNDAIGSGDYACWKFSFSVNCIAGIATISSPIVYDTTSAPFHVVQAGVSPYSSPWQSSNPAADVYISCSGANTVVSFNLLGIVGPVVTGQWSGCLNVNIQLPFGSSYPVYTP